MYNMTIQLLHSECDRAEPDLRSNTALPSSSPPPPPPTSTEVNVDLSEGKSCSCQGLIIMSMTCVAQPEPDLGLNTAPLLPLFHQVATLLQVPRLLDRTLLTLPPPLLYQVLGFRMFYHAGYHIFVIYECLRCHWTCCSTFANDASWLGMPRLHINSLYGRIVTPAVDIAVFIGMACLLLYLPESLPPSLVSSCYVGEWNTGFQALRV